MTLRWFSLKHAEFSEMSLTRKGILEDNSLMQQQHYLAPNSLYQMLRDELDFKNLN